MTKEELFTRVKFLSTLPVQHLSYLRYALLYKNYIQENKMMLGSDLAEELLGLLFQKASKLDNSRSILRSAIDDLGTIYRMREINLNRLPVENYLFARKICTQFLNEIKLSDFLTITKRSLHSDFRRYKNALASLFYRMKETKEYHVYYAKFRNVLLAFLAGNILLPQDVAPYRQVIDIFEDQIEKADHYLSIIEEKKEKPNCMNAFGKNTSLIRENSFLSKNAIFFVMEKGISGFLELDESKDEEKAMAAKLLWGMVRVSNEEPLYDFLYDKKNGLSTIYCRTQNSIIRAQKVAQSVLNMYSSELLLQTALTPYLDIQRYGVFYEKEKVMEQVRHNLLLLQAGGIINFATQEKYIKEIEQNL